MANLTFINSLSDEQAAYALKVAQKAEEMGIPKTLALGIVMNESQFNPKVKDSSAGAIGLMQVMPATGKALGYTKEQLRNEDTNIEAGLKALKANLDRTKGDWLLSAALYNAGDTSLSNTNVKEKGIPAETADYVKKLQNYGVFNTEPEEAATPAAVSGAAPVTDAAPATGGGEDEVPANISELVAASQARTAADRKIIEDAQSRTKAQIGGAGVGATIAAKRMAPAAIRASAKMLEEGRLAAQAEADALRLARATGAVGNAAGTVGSAGSAAGATGGAGPLSTAVEGNGRRPPGRGAGLFNYGIDAGLTDIEAARALDMTKQEGGAHDLLTQRREAMNQVRRVAPNQFVENPRFGGLMTPTAGGGGGPRESFRMTPEVPASPELPGGQPAAMRPIPVAAPISTAPPKPSGLEYVRDLFAGMMDSKLARGAGTVMRYAAPPLALAGAAGEGMNIAQELEKPSDQRDYGDMALSGLGAAAGLASLAAAPAVAIPAGLAAVGIGGYRYLRDRAAADRARQRMSGQPMR
jgi:hypothetical protein